MKNTDLKDKVIVVTGGAGILCSVLAKALARQGAKIAILDLNLNAAENIANEIKEENGNAIGLQADVLSKKSLQTAHKKINASLGSCDILINGAGGNHPKGTTSKTTFDLNDLKQKNDTQTFFDLDEDGIQFVFNLNFLGTLLPTQVFAEDMVEKGGCSIINISSMSAFQPLTKIPAYSGAKAAVSNFTKWLAVHFAPSGIRVNAMAPGFFLTEQNRQLLTKSDGSITDRGNTILEHTPMGRFGEPEDLTSTLLWLASKDSSFVTGVIVPIDGGFSAFSGV